MEAISSIGITLNPEKCVSFGGLKISTSIISPDLAKVEVLKYLTPSTNKTEPLLFLCMIQSYS